MPKIESLDPRITRAEIEANAGEMPVVQPMEYFETYEVFHQNRKGQHHIHVGSVHAPNPAMAFVFAKEQYSRRSECVNLWVVRTADVCTVAYDDIDMYASVPEKQYREPGFYKVRNKIEKFKKEHADKNSQH